MNRFLRVASVLGLAVVGVGCGDDREPFGITLSASVESLEQKPGGGEWECLFTVFMEGTGDGFGVLVGGTFSQRFETADNTFGSFSLVGLIEFWDQLEVRGGERLESARIWVGPEPFLGVMTFQYVAADEATGSESVEVDCRA